MGWVCYLLFVSTTTDEDLAALPSPLYRFVRDPAADTADMKALLAYPHRWFLECQYGGCSCHFRHVMRADDRGFGPPEDWIPEEEDDIESTRAVYDLFARIIGSGHQVDVVDLWEGTPPEDLKQIPVSLGQVPPESFRFLEGRRLVLSP